MILELVAGLLFLGSMGMMSTVFRKMMEFEKFRVLSSIELKDSLKQLEILHRELERMSLAVARMSSGSSEDVDIKKQMHRFGYAQSVAQDSYDKVVE